ncbi:MAG TPA: helix-turn-helix domain-containing protein [Actinomycetes bacterium]|nr:helix-turn-helix domain-containing protein [Actinomycetes bacterium]
MTTRPASPGDGGGADRAPRRAYRSPLRDAQVQATRRAVVAAAHDLFVEVGYAAATVDAIAERAGVSRKTVFTAVGGKAVLLDRALDLALRGDEDQRPVSQRPEIRAEAEETDPTRLVHLWVRRLAVIERRVARLALVLAAAADGDPDAARLHESSERGRREMARRLAGRLAEIGGLRRGVDVDRAEVIAALVSEPLVYQRLVLDAGWTVAAYARWTQQTLVDALLPR